MLLGLDHITLNLGKNKDKFKRNYFKLFESKKAVNNLNKKIFLRRFKKKHFITFFTSKDNVPDYEFTCYSSKNLFFFNCIEVKDNNIIIKTSDLKADKTILSKIFKIKNKITSIFNNKNFKISFTKKNQINYYLDDVGTVGLALVVSGIKNYYKNLSKINKLEMTKIFDYKINKRKNKIFFFRLPGGLIIEIIEYF